MSEMSYKKSSVVMNSMKGSKAGSSMNTSMYDDQEQNRSVMRDFGSIASNGSFAQQARTSSNIGSLTQLSSYAASSDL